MKKKFLSAISPGRMRHAQDYRDLPKAPGLYRHVDRNSGEILYVGMSNNLLRRNYQHSHNGRFSPEDQRIEYALAKTETTRETLRENEKKHIARHNPRNNRNR